MVFLLGKNRREGENLLGRAWTISSRRGVKELSCLQGGGPRNIASRMTPMKTVQLILVLGIRNAHRTAGYAKSGNGQRSSLQKLSSVFLPLNCIKSL